MHQPSLEELEKELKSRNIRLSYQRLMVLEYLRRNLSHPTVDQVFTALQKHIPTLSRTTVYTTLRVLTEAGLTQALTIEDGEIRYDLRTQGHGHFQCDACGKIRDFTLDIDKLSSPDLRDCRILNKNVYFNGLCPDCFSRTDTADDRSDEAKEESCQDRITR